MMRIFKKKISKITHRRIASFDIETYSDKNLFLMGSVYSDKGCFVFWDCEKMIKYILRDLKGYWIYATNLDFDFFALFENYLSKYPQQPYRCYQETSYKPPGTSPNQWYYQKQREVHLID